MLLHLLVHSGQGDEGVIAVQEDGVLDVLTIVRVLGVGVTEVLDLRSKVKSCLSVLTTQWP